ncbi:MAG TPA: DUF2203 domain-containing protein [Methylomirabilota bacterium]|nr:DUF2203 domain-containing protein [Methylomirabilota bacterium]
MDSGSRRYFTLAEVEDLIPRLEPIMGAVMDAHAEAARVRADLQQAQRRLMLAGGARLEPEFWRSRKVRFERATGAVQKGLGEVVKLGGAPKDLELGLVDFLARLDKRDVNLCWRFGEKRIRYWHGLDEGYAARRPWPGAPPGPD